MTIKGNFGKKEGKEGGREGSWRISKEQPNRILEMEWRYGQAVNASPGKENESHMAFSQTIISSSNFFLLFASPVHRLTSGSQATKAAIADR